MGDHFAGVWQSNHYPPTLKKIIFRTAIEDIIARTDQDEKTQSWIPLQRFVCAPCGRPSMEREVPKVCISPLEGMDSNFQYAEAVKLVVSPFSYAGCNIIEGEFTFAGKLYGPGTIAYMADPHFV